MDHRFGSYALKGYHALLVGWVVVMVAMWIVAPHEGWWDYVLVPPFAAFMVVVLYGIFVWVVIVAVAGVGTVFGRAHEWDMKLTDWATRNGWWG